MAHMIDSFAYSKPIMSYLWWLGSSDVDPRRVHCWGDADAEPMAAYDAAMLYAAEPEPVRLVWFDANDTAPHRVPTKRYRAWKRADGTSLIAINGPDYTILPNRDLMRMIPWPVQCAGSLQEGRRVFAQARIPGLSLDVGRANGRRYGIAPLALFYNAHDGSGRYRCRFCSTITVCHNTVTAALAEEGMAELSLKHTSQLLDTEAVAAQVKELFDRSIQSFDKQQARLQEFANRRMHREEAKRFFATLLLHEECWSDTSERLKTLSERSRVLLKSKGEQLMALFDSGLGQNPTDDKTKLDSLQAVTEFIDHQRGRSVAWRRRSGFASLNSSMFGDGHNMKQRAVKLLANW